MLSNVLKSDRAIEVSILVIEAFVKLRTALHEKAIVKCLDDIRRLTPFPEPTRRGIGFTAKWPEEK